MSIDTTGQDSAIKSGWSKKTTFFIGLVIALAALGISIWFMRNKPRTVRQPPAPQVPVVEILRLCPTNERVVIEAMGLAIPAREVRLQPEVSGRIVHVHPQLVEGGIIREGEVLVRIEDRTYRAAQARAQAALKTAQSSYRIEEGQQQLAKEDWALMQQLAPEMAADQALALREPQRDSAQAAVESAQAALDEATFNLEHTVITAPFDAAVVSADAEIGARAAPGTVLAHLVGTKAGWVRASIPVDQLEWLQFRGGPGGRGSAAVIYLQGGQDRQGEVIRRLPDLELNARMARILVEVKDPLALEHGQAAPLLLNDYVRLAIEGAELKEVYDIPRKALRDGHEIWLMDGQGTLRMHPITLVWGNREHVAVRASLPPEPQLIISELAAPVEGMAIRAQGAEGMAQGAEGIAHGAEGRVPATPKARPVKKESSDVR